MNSFDLMIEKYSKELIETGKKSIISAVEDEKEAELTEIEKNHVITTVAATVVEEKNATVRDSGRQINHTENKADNEEGSGRLKIQTFAADGVYPVVAANVKVFKKGEAVPCFEGYTDASGIIDNIILPAPIEIDTDLPPETEPYYEYDIEITHPKFISKKYKNVPVFDNINSIQTARLIPLDAGVDEDSEVIESENENLMKRDDANG